MIRVITLEPYDPQHVDRLCRLLHQSFGVGCEHTAELQPPQDLERPYDATALLSRVEAVRLFGDDRALYLTRAQLQPLALPTGKLPVSGRAERGGTRALVSTHGYEDVEASIKPLGRLSLHQLGKLWDLHHCIDSRCSMYPPWTEGWANADATFCNFCREKSETKIRLATP